MLRISEQSLLQEVGLRSEQRLRDLLAARGLRGWHHSGDAACEQKRYGNAIVSHGEVVGYAWASDPGPRWPQLLARAVLRLDGSAFDVIVAHMPNGSANGWRSPRRSRRSPRGSLLAIVRVR